jgi:hypothetical protein
MKWDNNMHRIPKLARLKVSGSNLSEIKTPRSSLLNKKPYIQVNKNSMNKLLL